MTTACIRFVYELSPNGHFWWEKIYHIPKKKTRSTFWSQKSIVKPFYKVNKYRSAISKMFSIINFYSLILFFLIGNSKKITSKFYKENIVNKPGFWMLFYVRYSQCNLVLFCPATKKFVEVFSTICNNRYYLRLELFQYCENI